jgi:hypothetical protein
VPTNKHILAKVNGKLVYFICRYKGVSEGE